MKKNKIKKTKYYSLIVFCLVLLFNPNLNVIDIFPDFIAYFILAKLFEKPADSAPYFEEARTGFIRLGFLNLAKIGGLFIIISERSHNSFNNDIIPLVSFVFAVCELILMLMAIRNIFDALFRLGERSDAAALIRPFPTTRRGKYEMPPEMLRSFTYLFAICKCVVYFLPDVFLLTRTNDSPGGTQIITISKYYPIILLISQFIGIIVGILWLSRMLKYIRSIRKEGKFLTVIAEICKDNETQYEQKSSLRRTKFGFTLLFIASILSFELSFIDLNEINILPHFIYAILLTSALHKITANYDSHSSIIISGGAYTLTAILFYIFQFSFLSKYGYMDLVTSEAARDAYATIKLLSILEFFTLTLLLAFAAVAMHKFILSNTGLSPNSDRYGNMEKSFHKGMLIRSYLLFAFAFLSGAAKCVNVFINGTLEEIKFVDPNVGTMFMLAPAVEWFGLVVVATTIIYAGYSLYFASTLKEELDIKYKEW